MRGAIQVDGLWDEGYALDQYVASSEYVGEDVFGHPQFNATYTPIGKLLHAMKYNGHLDASDAIAEQCAAFLTRWLADKPVDIILPAPPTVERAFQPVYQIAEAVSAKTHIPYADDVLKKKSGPPAKNIEKSKRDMRGSVIKLKPATRKCSVLLLDDLYSTGGTANECVTVLKADPLVAAVYYLAIAKTR